MKSRMTVMAVIFLLGVPRFVFSQEVISGEKWNEFIASSAGYMNRSVILEDTFKKIDDNFNRVEDSNNLTAGRHVKFRLGQCPYPCIGLRLSPVMNGLKQAGPGDLVRVTGMLKTLRQKPPRISSEGTSARGAHYKEKTRVYAAPKTQIYFDVGAVVKDWEEGATPKRMFAEGANLDESDYMEVKPGESQLEQEVGIEKLVARAITFKGTYEGIDAAFTPLEQAAGLSAYEAVKFKVDTGRKTIACLIPFSAEVLQAFKEMPSGTRVQVYGRIRMKNTPKGVLVGFIADKVDAMGTGGKTASGGDEIKR
jgi:hypothetical protein